MLLIFIFRLPILTSRTSKYGATTMKNKILTVLLATFWLSSLAQCGEKNGLSKDIEFTLIPNNPVVVFSDLTLNPGATNRFTAQQPLGFYFNLKLKTNQPIGST